MFLIQDNRNKNIDYIMILSGDQLYRMDYMDFVQACVSITDAMLFIVYHLMYILKRRMTIAETY